MAVVQIETRRTELEGTLQMIREGWAYCDSQGEERVTSQAFYDKLSAELDALVATGAATGTSREGTPDALRPITSRPLAGVSESHGSTVLAQPSRAMVEWRV